MLALVLLGGIVIALLTPSRPTTGYLDPGNPGPQGTRALAAILAQRGQPVIRGAAGGARDAVQDAGHGPGRAAPRARHHQPRPAQPRQLGELTRLPGNVIVVEPDSATLSALNREAAGTAAPQVTVAGADAVRPVRPDCR